MPVQMRRRTGGGMSGCRQDDESDDDQRGNTQNTSHTHSPFSSAILAFGDFDGISATP